MRILLKTEKRPFISSESAEITRKQIKGDSIHQADIKICRAVS